jgi:hypothetical protein
MIRNTTAAPEPAQAAADIPEVIASFAATLAADTGHEYCGQFAWFDSHRARVVCGCNRTLFLLAGTVAA